MNDTKQSVSERGPEYLAATLREVAEMLEDVGKTINARLAAWAAAEPCPEEEKPETVTVAHGAGAMRFDRLTAITARLTLDNKPGLFVTGTVGATDGATFTTTPIADIRKQAAEAGIELPEVTVNIDSYRWTAIERADCHVCDDGSLLTGIIGVAERYGEHTIHTSTLTPAQVVVLCELAGWPKPEVKCVFAFCDGTACEVDPARVTSVRTFRTTATRETRVWMGDDDWRIVREPVAVVQRMIDVCKEGE